MTSKLKIGSLELENNIIVGPMAGISNQSYREMVKQFDPGLVCSEMISDKAIVYNNRKTMKMTEVSAQERPLSLQLFGHEMESMVQAACFFDRSTDCDIIDINMGCPVPKVVNTGAGSALLKDPEYAGQLVKAIVQAVKKPVTVKIRSGWDDDHITAVQMAEKLEAAGAAAICVHPRTRNQYYAGHSNWDIICQVKQAVKIPVIGNGDIKTVDDMIEMGRLTNCDGFMVARGALGNPWLISQLVHYQRTGERLPDPDYRERISQCLQHAHRLCQLKGERVGIKEMRGHACWYINGLPNNNRVKARINETDTLLQLETLMGDYLWALDNDDFVGLFKEDL